RRTAAIFHDHDHGFRLARGDQVIEDEVHLSLHGPAALILASAVLQIEHRISGVGIVIAGRRIDICLPPRVADFREVRAYPNIAMWNILRIVKSTPASGSSMPLDIQLLPK